MRCFIKSNEEKNVYFAKVYLDFFLSSSCPSSSLHFNGLVTQDSKFHTL